MKIINSDLKELNKESTLRSDFRYILSNSKDYKKTIKFRELFEIISISKKDRLKLIEKIG